MLEAKPTMISDRSLDKTDRSIEKSESPCGFSRNHDLQKSVNQSPYN